jgi:AmmeMemoRadiSam system protein A
MSRLDNDDRRILLEIARRAIAQGVAKREPIAADAAFAAEIEARGVLSEPASAFVTLRHGKRLRGCIGRLDSNEPLARVVALAAKSAAMEDPRFEPMRAEELIGLDIEISVLSAFEEVAPAQVRAGIHGLMIERGARRGLLLPQVASEFNWSAERFLDETCAKAGLPTDAWREAGTRVWVFTAEVFSERDLPEMKSGADSYAAPQ